MTQSPPLPIFKAAIVAAAPMLAISSEKKGAKMLYTPVGLTERQRIRQSITWILESTDKRPQRSFEKRHATELLSILDGTSPVLEKLDQRHKMGMINRCVEPAARVERAASQLKPWRWSIPPADRLSRSPLGSGRWSRPRRGRRRNGGDCMIELNSRSSFPRGNARERTERGSVSSLSLFTTSSCAAFREVHV